MTSNSSNGAPAKVEPGTVKLSIPCSAEYVSVARLAILGIAGRLPFSYDEVEDIRLAVGEACTHAVERCRPDGVDAPSHEGRGTIEITSHVTPDRLVIEVVDDVPTGGSPTPTPDAEVDASEIDREGLGALLMEILVDEVELITRPHGTTVRLVKNSASV